MDDNDATQHSFRYEREQTSPFLPPREPEVPEPLPTRWMLWLAVVLGVLAAILWLT